MASIEVLSINGWTAFESIEVGASFKSGARTFEAVLAAELGASATNQIFKVGTEVTITTNGDLLVTGFVEGKEPDLTPQRAIITISGRSASADLIDSSALHETGYFENMDPLQIGQAVSQGIRAQWMTDQQLEKVDQYKLQWGESCYRCVEKLTRAQGFTITGTKDGNALITKAGTKRQGGSLIEGVNILRGRGNQNGRNRHSKITVRGQRPSGHDDQNLWIEAEDQDSAVQRFRPLLIVQDEDTDHGRAQKRAKNRKDRAAGDALKAAIWAQGFHDDTGQIWEPGNLVWTESPFLDIAQDMLIETIKYRQDERGSIATLGLVDPQAYGGSGAGGGKGSQSGDEWDIG